MVTKLEELAHGMVNVGFGAAALTAEKGREVLDTLNAKGEEVRGDSTTPDFARSMSDALEQAGDTFNDITERLANSGEGVAERVLDEIILARVRLLSKSERTEFLAHVRDLVDSVDDATVTVKVETVEVETETAPEAEAADAASVDTTEEQGE